MFERIFYWVDKKSVQVARRYGQYMLKQERCWELQLRKEGRFDEANTMRETADDLERLVEKGFVLEAELNLDLASC